MLTQSQVKHFQEQGYVIVPGLNPALLEPLRRASAAKVEEWSKIPLDQASDRYWVQFRPGIDDQAFLDYMASDKLLGTMQDLIGPNLVWNALFCLLGAYRRGNWARVWHRDGMNRYNSPEEEVAILMQRQLHAQWNCALYEGDNCLQVIPGSHRRPITAQEVLILRQDPNADLPNQVVVELQVGEAVYYNHLLIHRGVYKEGLRRETLHGHIMAVEQPWETIHVARGAEYMLEAGYLESVSPHLRPMFENTIAYMHKINQGQIPAPKPGDGMGSREYVEFVTAPR
ncbi:MAG: hypothetical protein EXR62_03430 [Chloroflexi bacterium]|nr:hypothetical protein [Chloroflexota bacterium]